MDSTFADHFMQYLNGKGLYVTEEDNDSESGQRYRQVCDTESAVMDCSTHTGIP